MADEKYIFPEATGDPLDSVETAASNFFTGVPNVATEPLSYYTTGYALISWRKLPSWFQKSELKHFKALTEKTFRNFNGVDDISLQMQTIQVGFGGAREVNVPGGITVGSTQFSMDFNEYDHAVLSRMITIWVSAIRDPNTGISTYGKKYGIDYSVKNHSGELLYIVLRPDVTNKKSDNVQFACFYMDVQPTNIPLSSLFQFDRGSSDVPTMTLTFTGVPFIGPKVNAYARNVLRNELITVTDTNDGLPFVDIMGDDADATAALKSQNSFTEIFGDKTE